MTACYVGTPEGKLLKCYRNRNGKALITTTVYRNLPKARFKISPRK